MQWRLSTLAENCNGGTYAHKNIAFEFSIWIAEGQPARPRHDQPAHLHLQHGEHQRRHDQRWCSPVATPEETERNRHPANAHLVRGRWKKVSEIVVLTMDKKEV